MKHKILFLFCLLPVFGVFAQKNYIQAKQYLLKGKICNEVCLPPPCGFFAFGTVIEFEIINFSDSAYFKKNIAVIFTCPDFYKKNFFEVGKTYLVNLFVQDNKKTIYEICNINVLEKYNPTTTFWAWDVKKID